MFPRSQNRAALIERLVSERTGKPMLERLCADIVQQVVFDRSDWVGAYVDTENSISLEARGLTATRAITLQGRLIWLVRSRSYRRAFHSRETGVFDAFNDASRAWQRRQAQRAHRGEVLKIVRALRVGRLRYRITVQDAYASPLCEEGVDGFLRALGVGRFQSFPGWLIAWCFALDRQVGFVIWEAHQRYMRERGPAEGLQGA